MNCKTCKYWFSPKSFDAMGFCRRFPQTQTKASDEWCGEHKEITVFTKKPSSNILNNKEVKD
jgi:hypothetical protein